MQKKKQDTMTWPQNVGNRISEDLNFKIFRGRMPRTPIQGTAFGRPIIEPPSVKSWIRPRNSEPNHSFHLWKINVSANLKLVKTFGSILQL